MAAAKGTVPFVLAAAVAAPALAEDMVERARQIREQLLAKKRESDEQEQRAASLGRMVLDARQRLTNVQAELDAAERKRAKAAVDSEQAVSRLAELDGVVGRERAVHRARVAGIYRAARIGAGAAGWTGVSSENVRLARYLVTAAAAGSQKVARIEIERGSHLAALDRARGEQETATTALAELEAERSALETDVARAEQEAEGFRTQAKTSAAGLAELEASARTLEKELAALAPKRPAAPEPAPADKAPVQVASASPATPTPPASPGKPAAPDAAVASLPASAPATQQPAPASAAAPAQPAAPEKRPGLLSRIFRGGNADAERFAANKGALSAPTSGKIVASYGQEHKSGNKYRGVIIRSKGGSSVRSVAEGQVIFSGALSGMGNTVIVSHGGRYHTVYARLGSLRFQEGDRIGAGDVVGAMPADDPDLHFELRDGGQAVDPLPWVKGGGQGFGQ